MMPQPTTGRLLSPAWRDRLGVGAIALLAVPALSLLDAVNAKGKQWWYGGTDGFWYMAVHVMPPWAIFVLLALLVRALVRRWPLGDGRNRRGSRAGIAVHAAFAVLFPVVHMVALALIDRALGQIDSFTTRAFNLVRFYYVSDLALYALLAAGFHAIDYRQRFRARAMHELELQALLKEARLQALHEQLSPHFLFNVLNTVTMLIWQQRPDDAVATLNELSTLLRTCLQDSPPNEIPLGEELALVERYLGLEQIRFNDRLHVEVSCDDVVRRARVPRLILQPLAENAVRHGVSRVTGTAMITIGARRRDDRLVIEVRDNGAGLPPGWSASQHTGIGIRNVRDRLLHLYGDAASLDIAPLPRGGVMAAVMIPYANGEPG